MSYWVARPSPRTLASAIGQPYANPAPVIGGTRVLNGTTSDYFMRLRGARLLNGLDLPPPAMNEPRAIGSYGISEEDYVQASVGVLSATVVTYDAGRKAPEILSHDGSAQASAAIQAAVNGGTVTNLSDPTTNAPVADTLYAPGGTAATGTEEEGGDPVYSEQQAANDAEFAAQQAIIAAGAGGAAATATYAEPEAAPPPPAEEPYYDPYAGGGGGGGGTVSDGGGSVPTEAPPPPPASDELIDYTGQPGNGPVDDGTFY